MKSAIDEPTKSRAASPPDPWLTRKREGSYVATVLMVAAATAVGALLARSVGTATVDLLYLLPVMVAASFYGLRQGLVASIASALAYNFFFIEPVHSFHIAEASNIVTVLMLLAVAIVTNQLAGRMRTLAQAALESAANNETLVGFARQLLACATAAEVGDTTCREASRLFKLNSLFLMPGEDKLALVAGKPPEASLSGIDQAAADVAFQEGQRSGRGSGRYNAADWTFFPLRIGGRVLGILGLARDDGSTAVPPKQMPLLDSMLDQAALALERARLEREMLDVAQLRERDRLRGALLSSVGHDLRTPLTAILAAAAELRRRAPDIDPLIETLESESRRLDRLIANLLDMVRVEAGAIKLKLEAVDLTEAVASAIDDVRRGVDGRVLQTDIPHDLPLLRADPQLLHHCLINLLDNAGQHSPPGSVILIAAAMVEGGVNLRVADQGPGIPAGSETEIFERFTRLGGSDRQGGAGLGLAIVKGFADCMGLQVWAGNRLGTSGAEFTIRFPAALLVPMPEAAAT
jgi:two-component system sensor histidine kinase KdpD